MNKLTQNMRDISLSIIEGYNEEEKVVVNAFINECKKFIAGYMLRSDNLVRVNDLIFLDPTVTKFILDLHFNLFALSRVCNDFDKLICNTLADAISLDSNSVLNIIPNSVKSSLACECNKTNMHSVGKEDNVSDFLFNNRHVVIVLLINLLI